MQFARQNPPAPDLFTLALFGLRLDAVRFHDVPLHPMTLAVIHTRALVGLHAPEVVVEVHLANGLPSFTLVGLADTEVKEARERVRAALAQSGFAFPHNKRITVNLAPADLPKVTTCSLIANLLGKCETQPLHAKFALHRVHDPGVEGRHARRRFCATMRS